VKETILAVLTTEHTFDGAPGVVFAGIRQYAKYPDYLPGVTKVDVLPAKQKGSTCQVRYELKLIKSFFYTLNMFEESPTRIWWDLDDSNIMKQSAGSWTLKDAPGGKTHATYALDIAFSGLVPQRIVDQITKANLPLMMKGFQKLIVDTKG
jgi:ribosome-associated toxin RatA of RatAB toxin-antitoxin module